MTKISAVEKGRVNKERYADYVAELEATGRQFPLNNFGEVNLSSIAKACGFNRQVFINNESMKVALAEDVSRIGTEAAEARSKESKLSKKMAEKSEEASRLQKALDANFCEIEALKNQVNELKKHIAKIEERNHEMDTIFDELLSSGRRYYL